MQVSRLWGVLPGVLLGCALIAAQASEPPPPSLPPTRDADACPAAETLVSGADNDYRRKLIAWVHAHAFYPRSAATSGLAGVAQLCVLVDRQGNVQKALINTSTGFPLLDGAALYTVGRARADGDMEAMPQEPGDGANSIWFEVPAGFKLPAGTKPVAPAPGDDSACLHGEPGNGIPDWEKSAEFQRYREQITQKFREQMVFPPEAALQKKQLQASICMVMSRDGSLQRARIWHSAGDPLFDGILLMAAGVVAQRKDLGPMPDVVPQSLDKVIFLLPVTWGL